METVEKSQEQIIYENTCMNLATGDYHQYLKSPNSAGAICQWLRAYSLHEYDSVTIGYDKDSERGEVRLWNRLLAWYNWDKELDMPIFTCNLIDLQLYDTKQRILYMQENYMKCKDKYDNPYKGK